MSYAVGHSKLSIMRKLLLELDVPVSSFTNHDELGVMQASHMCSRAPPHDGSVVVHEGSATVLVLLELFHHAETPVGCKEVGRVITQCLSATAT